MGLFNVSFLFFLLSSSQHKFEKKEYTVEITYTKQRSKLLDLRFAARPSLSQGATYLERKEAGHRDSISQT